ncbi:Mediator of RNA polymerase II transcription subunit 25, partial [Linnemannia elongata]
MLATNANANAPTPGPSSVASPSFNIASPGAGASPMPLHNVSTPGPPTSLRPEILCVFVIENSARMGHSFELLLISYLEPILRHFRAPPIDPETNQPRPKDAPLVRCGLAIYGDYQPSSPATVDTKYFTNDPLTFLRELRHIRFEYGGVFRNAVAEGLVSALEMFDQHDELRGNEGPEPERHVVLVADSSPHLTGCRCNANEQYDNYSLSDVSQELLKRSISLSLISPSDHSELTELVTKVNERTFEIVEGAPKALPAHIVKLAGFQLPQPPPPVAPPAVTTPSISETPPATTATTTATATTNGSNKRTNGTTEPVDLKRETAGSPAATGMSPKLAGPAAKRTKIEDNLSAPTPILGAASAEAEDQKKPLPDSTSAPDSMTVSTGSTTEPPAMSSPALAAGRGLNHPNPPAASQAVPGSMPGHLQPPAGALQNISPQLQAQHLQALKAHHAQLSQQQQQA